MNQAEFTRSLQDGTFRKLVITGLSKQGARRQMFQLSYFYRTHTAMLKREEIEKGTIQLFIDNIVYFILIGLLILQFLNIRK